MPVVGLVVSDNDPAVLTWLSGKDSHHIVSFKIRKRLPLVGTFSSLNERRVPQRLPCVLTVSLVIRGQLVAEGLTLGKHKDRPVRFELGLYVSDGSLDVTPGVLFVTPQDPVLFVPFDLPLAGDSVSIQDQIAVQEQCGLGHQASGASAPFLR